MNELRRSRFLVRFDPESLTTDVYEAFDWGGRTIVAQCRDGQMAMRIAEALNAAPEGRFSHVHKQGDATFYGDQKLCTFCHPPAAAPAAPSGREERKLLCTIKHFGQWATIDHGIVECHGKGRAPAPSPEQAQETCDVRTSPDDERCPLPKDHPPEQAQETDAGRLARDLGQPVHTWTSEQARRTFYRCISCLLCLEYEFGEHKHAHFVGYTCGELKRDVLVELRPGERIVSVDAEALARRFHEAYERLAPSYAYRTRINSAVPWEKVPENNRRLMVAVCAEILSDAPPRAEGPPVRTPCVCDSTSNPPARCLMHHNERRA